jgi:predicted short-subunit dehydrogenase-like oxidoreductase (DUF2520 family)
MPGSTFTLEGDAVLVAQLDLLVKALGGTAIHLKAEDKTLYHAAAVIASNYTVTLAALASDLLARHGIAPDRNTALHYLLPLMRGTVNNLDVLGLPAALTGPLARGDASLYRHLACLTLPLAQQKGGLDEETVAKLEDELRVDS